MNMKKEKNPIVIAIIVLLIVFIGIVFVYFSTTDNSNNETNTSATIGTSQVKATIQTIENTLESSGQISSGLDEKLKLHASYYFEELLIDENVYVKEGENIVEYTNGTYLTAPYDCVIVGSNLPNEDEICTTSHYVEVKSIETLCMNLSIGEADINKVEIGDSVEISITATGEKIEGYITSVSEVGTYSSSGSYFALVVTFENNGNLKIGMSATCEIKFEKAENVVSVPIEAVQTSDEGKYVIVVKENGETENVMVETGISNDAYIEIKSGITENTTVQMQESESSSSSNFGNRGGSNFPGGNFGGETPNGGMMEMPSGGMGGERPQMP